MADIPDDLIWMNCRDVFTLDLLHDSYNAVISLKLNELTAEHVIASPQPERHVKYKR